MVEDVGVGSGPAEGGGVTFEARADAPGLVTVLVRGELDMATAPLLNRFMAEQVAAATSPTALVVDLAGVTFCGSSGLSVLVGWHRGHPAHPLVTLYLSGVLSNRRVARALSVTGLSDLLPRYPGREG